jgi:hypothetical protein
MDSEKKLLMTMTGEIHQPVRLYYQVVDQAAVLNVFAKLRCLDEDQDNHRWVWLYHGEAKTLTFHTSYAAIPRKMRPIVLGAFRFTSPQGMTLDVRSCERATQAVVFFDRYLKQSIAHVTHAALVNHLFPATADGLPALEGLFAPKAISGKALTMLEWACSDDPPGMQTPTLYVRPDHVHTPCHVGQPAVAQSITNCRPPPRSIQHDRPHTARL